MESINWIGKIKIKQINSRKKLYLSIRGNNSKRMMAGAWLLDRYLWKYEGFLVRGRIFPMVVNLGLGKEVIAVASAVEKGNQQPAMHHEN